MDTEEKLVLAALRQFEKHGFIAATTKAIAAEAGVAEVTLFRYFGDKKTLFSKVAAYVASDIQLMEIPHMKTGNVHNDILRLCRSILQMFIRYNALFRMLIFEASKYEDIQVVVSQVRGRAIQNIQQLAKQYFHTDPEHAHACAQWMGNSLMGTSLSYCLFHHQEDKESFVIQQSAIVADAFIQQMKAMET